jgi:2'-5' RNA ligase
MEMPILARLFVALTLPPAVAQALVAVQRELHGALSEADIRWTARNDLHITLCFLGNVERDRIAALVETLQRSADDRETPVLSCAGLGCFPSSRAPRTLWAGVRNANGQMQSIVAGMRAATLSFTAAPPEKQFAAHVTLGRCRALPAADKRRFREFVRSMETREFGTWRAHEFVLMESAQAPAGGGYEILERFAFG